MKKSREQIIEEQIREERKANPNLKVLPVSAFPKSNKRNSLAEMITTQEQADFLRKQLEWLQREEEEEERKQKKEK